MKYFECFGGVMRETRDGKWVMRHEAASNAVVATHSASHSSDYAAALKVYGEYVSSDVSTIEHLVTFPSWCEERLNSAKAPKHNHEP